MGFDIVHLNVHKTFATPHGGGGPGAGPVAVRAKLAPFLPGPRPVRAGVGYELTTPERSIGRVHSWHGNALVLLRAWMYLRLNGGDGLQAVSQIAVLNANWFKERLRGSYDIAYDRPVMHECVVSAKSLHHEVGLSAQDVAKRLMELGFHPPTVYFPLIVEEALMVEPTETESPETLAALGRRLLAGGTRGPPSAPMPTTPRPPPAPPPSDASTMPGRPASSPSPSTSAVPARRGETGGRQSRALCQVGRCGRSCHRRLPNVTRSSPLWLCRERCWARRDVRSPEIARRKHRSLETGLMALGG